MAGFNSHPKVFGNALDVYRKIIFHNGDQGQRVRNELLGDPSNYPDQRRAGPYSRHVAASLRFWPHKFQQWSGCAPAHIMLAAYSGSVCGLVTSGFLVGEECVIVTQQLEMGGTMVTMWQRGSWAYVAEGMTFHLLDRLDGDVPAVCRNGVLRKDQAGAMVDAPSEIHRLWGSMETNFLLAWPQAREMERPKEELWWWQVTLERSTWQNQQQSPDPWWSISPDTPWESINPAQVIWPV